MGVWGHSVRIDILVEFFNFQIEAYGLIDIEPISKGPSWKNNRASARGISKRIDIFFVSYSVLKGVDRYRSWIDTNRCSDHNPIFLELDIRNSNLDTPFKFNPRWLE
jgi:hypothetical protein